MTIATLSPFISLKKNILSSSVTFAAKFNRSSATNDSRKYFCFAGGFSGRKTKNIFFRDPFNVQNVILFENLILLLNIRDMSLTRTHSHVEFVSTTYRMVPVSRYFFTSFLQNQYFRPPAKCQRLRQKSRKTFESHLRQSTLFFIGIERTHC